MKKIFCFAMSFCFLFLFTMNVFGQETYVLPKPDMTANLIAAIKAQAESFPGLHVDASDFVPGTNIPAGITEVTFKFAKPAEEGEGILEPWLVALLPTSGDTLVSDFVVRQRFSSDDEYFRVGGRGDPRVDGYLQDFLAAVYARLDAPQEP